jgi:putative membrane protein
MIRLIIRWVLFALALIFVAWVVPGITLDSFMTALWTALVIGLVNIFIRPVLLLLTLPINLLTLGLLTFIINGLMFWMVATFVGGFAVSGFLAAFFGALVLSFLSMFINEV